MAVLLKKIIRRLTHSTASELAGLSVEDRRIVAEIRRKRLTYLSGRKLARIVETCRSIDTQSLDGIFVEAGCALGGSTILLASVKTPSRQLNVYDVFDMIPEPTDEDGVDVKKRYAKIKAGKSRGIRGNPYYGYEDNLMAKVRDNMASFSLTEEKDNVRLIKGLVQDTMVFDTPVAFAHIDVDWYEPVLTCLQRIVPRLVVGGSIILDDYHSWSGCRTATDEFFQDRLEDFRMSDSSGAMTVTRIAMADGSINS